MSAVKRRARGLSMLVTLLTSAAMLVAPTSAVADDPDLIIGPVGNSNGFRIYLSPAFHTGTAGARGECQWPGGDTARAERNMARKLAREVAHLTSTRAVVGGGSEVVAANSGLKHRGFTTRIGLNQYDVNTSRSNGWNAHAHIPIHSNASTPGGCGNTSGAKPVAGLRAIYGAGDSNVLANRFVNQLSGVTPGTGDRSCIPANCSQYSSLYELSADAAARAYSETEFHTWNDGVRFLVEDRSIAALRLARAIDNHF